jgi:tRNA G10  N-methylase Trm11
MNKYLITCASGGENIVAKPLKDSVINIYDGLLEIKSKGKLSDIGGIKGITNSFLILNRISTKGKFKSRIYVEKLNKTNLYNKELKQFIINKNIKSFRIMFSEQNQLKSLEYEQRKQLTTKIKQDYRLRYAKGNADIEFWIYTRSEKNAYFLVKDTSYKNYKTKKGELSKDIAQLLTIEANIQPNDIIIDPFCGYGGILKELKYSKSREVIGNEFDRKKAKHLKETFEDRKVKLYFKDFLNWNPNFKVTKIVTDPPWGLFSKISNIESFYKSTLKKCREISHPYCEVIMLIHRDIEFDPKEWELIKEHKILVNGQKASIIHLKILDY